MRRLILTLIFISNFCYAADKFTVTQGGHKLKPLVALLPKDNDLHIENNYNAPASSIPILVENKIGSDEAQGIKQWKDSGGDDSGLPADYFYGPIFRLSAPNKRDLYIFEVFLPLGGEYFSFILFDEQSKKVTEVPVRLQGKWSEGDWGAPLIPPLVSFQDLDGDGKDEIVIQERVHNGTMYNAIVYKYYEINDDLSFHQILALETRLFDLITEKDGGTIIRSFEKISGNEIKIIAKLDIPKDGSKSRELGEVILKRKSHSEPFQVVDRKVIDQNYGEFLITAWGISEENKFLSEGYTFYY